jgi:hypothetical protein
VSSDRLDPGECLRALTADALRQAIPGRSLLPVSLGLQATANAFVMLGLLAERRAEAILAEHRAALEREGFGHDWGVAKGELSVRSGAHDYWDARMAGGAGLREVPLSVAAAGTRCLTSTAEVRVEWVKQTPAGLRLSFHATSADRGRQPDDARTPLEQALAEISVTDDNGHRYRLHARGGARSVPRDRSQWQERGQLIAEPGPAGPAAWLEFGSPQGQARLVLPPAPQVATGSSAPAWATAAEGYLIALARVRNFSPNGVELDPTQTAQIIATVADALMATGALPVTSSWLYRAAPGTEPGWRTPLLNRWSQRAGQRFAGFRPQEHRGLAIPLPFEQAVAVIESVSARGDLVSIQLFGHPWVLGEYWPMITPCFQVRAVDDAGQEHEGISGGWGGLSDGQGSGGFWFWPPVDPARTSIRVTVSTLWESAWADILLPGRDS